MCPAESGTEGRAIDPDRMGEVSSLSGRSLRSEG